jgi:3-oxoacyl-[acyl-carrier protein] reductase
MRGFADRLEAERSILALIFNGLSSKHPSSQGCKGTGYRPTVEAPFGLQGQIALFVNSGTPFGTALCQSFLRAGVRLAVYATAEAAKRENPVLRCRNSDQLRLYSKRHDGPMNPALMKSIEKELGHIDIYIHDLGVGAVDDKDRASPATGSGKTIRSNLETAEEIATYYKSKPKGGLPARIVYIAPWAWDQYEDPVRYVSVKGSAVALTESRARQMAPRGLTVNCVVPGFLKTPRPSGLQKRIAAKVQATIPAGVLGEIREVVEAVLFLVGDSAKYITGQTLYANGGMLTSDPPDPQRA